MFNVFTGVYEKQKLSFKNKSLSYYICTNSENQNHAFKLIELVSNQSKEYDIDFDFAFVTIKNNSIFFLRDILGNIPLFIYETSGHIIFSNSVKEIIENEYFKPEINNNYISNFLSDNYYSISNFENQTIWKNLVSVNPKYILSYSLVDGWSENVYKLPNFQFSENDNYSFNFKKLFEEVLKSKIEKNHNFFASLSGGIDSSSIVCYLSELGYKFSTLEFRGGDEIIKEQSYVGDVLKKYDLNHNLIDANVTKFDYWNLEIDACSATGLPSYAYSIAGRDLKMLSFVRNSNSDIYITGQGGDDILLHNINYFDYCVRNKFWLELKISFSEYIKKLSSNHEKIIIENRIKRRIKSILLELILKKDIIQLIKFIKIHKPYKLLFISTLNFFKKKVISKQNKFDILRGNFVTFSENKRHNIDFENSDTNFNWYFEDIQNRISLANREYMFLLGKSLNVNVINPYFDFRLIKFMYSVPQKYNFGKGIGRFTLRESMVDILPISIINRNNKSEFSNFTFDVTKILIKDSFAKFDEFHLIWEYVNKDSFFSVANELIKIDNFRNNKKINFDIKILTKIIKIIYLGIWLDTYKVKLKINKFN